MCGSLARAVASFHRPGVIAELRLLRSLVEAAKAQEKAVEELRAAVAAQAVAQVGSPPPEGTAKAADTAEQPTVAATPAAAVAADKTAEVDRDEADPFDENTSEDKTAMQVDAGRAAASKRDGADDFTEEQVQEVAQLLAAGAEPGTPEYEAALEQARSCTERAAWQASAARVTP